MENQDQIINKTKEFVFNKLKDDSSGHDWWHSFRVWNIAKKIGREEKANLFTVELAALLHDIADWKLNNGDYTKSDKIIDEWLSIFNIDQSQITEIQNIIHSISFKGAGVKSQENLSIEAKVVQDADRLDALGAIGIARTFAYGGKFDRAIHDPGEKPVLHSTSESYLNSKSTSINHFYEKLLIIKDRMNTKTAKNIAIHRHQFLLFYLDEFHKEWNGLD
ncbi:MAG: HD domain-containing protein [Candidatus Methanofastidiosa archaeon]|nr:HD domain-containing protein [Candidatus Methanofastidiosa archaeon]